MTPEIEAKLALPASVYWALRDDPDLLGLPIVRRDFERQDNLFYDTASGEVRRSGGTLRARRVAGRPGVEWTHKSSRRLKDGIQTADEQVALGPDGPDPLELARDLPPVRSALAVADEPLRVDAASTTERVVLVVRVVTGGEIEVAIDRLRIPGEPVFVDYELEAEAHGAARSEVEALAADLSRRFDLSPSIDSKRARIRAFAEGRLGPRRLSAADLPSQLAKMARSRQDDAPLRTNLWGLSGGPAEALAAALVGLLPSLGVTSEVSVGLPEPGRTPEGVRLFVASSVHWRLLRYLAGRPDWSGALAEFANLIVPADRRTVEGTWRDADLVVLADQDLVPGEPASPTESVSYRAEDLPTGTSAGIWMSEGGDRLRFAARAYPPDLAAHANASFESGVSLPQAAALLEAVGYRRVGW